MPAHQVFFSGHEERVDYVGGGTSGEEATGRGESRKTDADGNERSQQNKVQKLKRKTFENGKKFRGQFAMKQESIN
ncbi:hypothetical protein B9Z55_026779 [Caenorhabditis nigoni]|uniref:Uncharacterized protein n=1 Tax=Caenorhabditis nigoni TaxID=1611254 RepID=A0A2G5SHW0_9PELO|nr:hypothetical protein B9Z55_026779 [Caenorhabditis nigoni]